MNHYRVCFNIFNLFTSNDLSIFNWQDRINFVVILGYASLWYSFLTSKIQHHTLIHVRFISLITFCLVCLFVSLFVLFLFLFLLSTISHTVLFFLAALEMLLDIAQHDYIPFVTDSAGIRMGIHNTHFKPILTSEGISISSQFETNIALKQVRIKSS